MADSGRMLRFGLKSTNQLWNSDCLHGVLLREPNLCQTSNLAKEFHLALFEASPGPVFAARFVRCSSYADELTVHGNKGRRWDVHPVSA